MNDAARLFLRERKSIFANLDHLNQFSFVHQQITNWIPETTGTFSQLSGVPLPLPQAPQLVSVLSSRKRAKLKSISGQNLGSFLLIPVHSLALVEGSYGTPNHLGDVNIAKIPPNFSEINPQFGLLS